jgi:DNA-binding NarL/FixJ family response regulator
MTTIALVDDHVLLRNGLASLIKDSGYNVLFEADHGKAFIEKIATFGIPDIVLLDINMPHMDGFETALWIKRNKPSIKVLALSMYDDEKSIIQMIKNGAKGYILKDSDPAELKNALNAVIEKGYYHSELITGRLMHSIAGTHEEKVHHIDLNEKEIQFLKLLCTEMTYKEIAETMNLSPRTVEGYRDIFFTKWNLKTRVGLVIYAIKQGIIKL